MVLGLRPLTERVGDGTGQPILDAGNGEELMHVETGVSIALGNRPPESPGTLYISTKRVVWLSDTDRTKGYSVDFLSVSLHAVSTDPEAYPLPCIYAQIETETGEDNESVDSDTECSEDLDVSIVTEMRLLPSDPSQLDALFDIFCECAELNPEPDQEEDEESNWVFGDEQMVSDEVGDDSEDLANPIGYGNGNHDLAHQVHELQINDRRFEDAEEGQQVAHERPQ